MSCSKSDNVMRCSGNNELPQQSPDTAITEVFVEEGIKIISNNCFKGFTALQKISLPNSLVKVGNDILADTRVASLFLPMNLKTISGSNSFDSNKFIEAINVDTRNLYFRSIDGVLYSRDLTSLHLFPTKKNTSYIEVPNKVKTIHYAAFYNPIYLKVIVLPPSLKRIDAYFTLSSESKAMIVLRNSFDTTKPTYSSNNFLSFSSLNEADIIYQTVSRSFIKRTRCSSYISSRKPVAAIIILLMHE